MHCRPLSKLHTLINGDTLFLGMHQVQESRKRRKPSVTAAAAATGAAARPLGMPLCVSPAFVLTFVLLPFTAAPYERKSAPVRPPRDRSNIATLSDSL